MTDKFLVSLPIKSIYRNKKNKKLYLVLSNDIISTTNAYEGKKMVLYSDEDMTKLFIRELDEFNIKFDFIKNC